MKKLSFFLFLFVIGLMTLAACSSGYKGCKNKGKGWYGKRHLKHYQDNKIPAKAEASTRYLSKEDDCSF
ncbi:MAG TPA: hypothetical protein ENJ44_00190 [Oceanospirillales bacterium]|nr:hypothetical protein [Oceanospirillales bacterium]